MADTHKNFPRFFAGKQNLYLILLIVLILAAGADYLALGLTRRTFVFYSALEGATIVEDRMIRNASSGETDIRRYVEEALLGPVSPDAAPLFPRETRLRSLIYGGGVARADFSEAAALPVPGSREGVFLGFQTLNEGIRRNFPSVGDVKFFIAGREIFFREFREIFGNPADNSSETGQ